MLGYVCLIFILFSSLRLNRWLLIVIPEQKRYPLLSQFSDEKRKTRRLQAKKSCTACEALATLSDLLLTPPRSYGLDWLPIKKSRPSNVNNHFTRAKTVFTRAHNGAHARTKTPRPVVNVFPIFLMVMTPHICAYSPWVNLGSEFMYILFYFPCREVFLHTTNDQFSTPE